MTHALPSQVGAARQIPFVPNLRWSRKPSAAWALVLCLCLPGVLFYFGQASSLALGTAVVSALLVITGMLSWHDARQARSAIGGWLIVGLVTALVTLHALCVAVVVDINLQRALTSLAPLALMLAGAQALAQRLSRVDGSSLDRALRGLALLMMAAAMLSGLGLSVPTPMPFPKPIFPYSEPSHFALAFTPVLMYVSATSTAASRWMWLGASLSLALWLQNLTLLVGVCLVMLTTLPWRMLLLASVPMAVLGAQLDLSYFTSRLSVGDDNENISYLVFIQGWQLVDDAWARQGALGLGFQQLGLQWHDVPVADLILRLAEDHLNLLDGGLTAAKVLAEWGLGGALLLLLHAVVAWKAFRRLRRLALMPRPSNDNQPRRPNDVALRLAYASILSLSVELWVRGVGYFSPTVLLALAGLWLWLCQRAARSGRRITAPHRRSSIVDTSPKGA